MLILTKKKYNKDKKFFTIYKMGKKLDKFYKYKSSILINDVDISKIVASNSVSFG